MKLPKRKCCKREVKKGLKKLFLREMKEFQVECECKKIFKLER